MGRFSRFKTKWSRKTREQTVEPVVCVSYRVQQEFDGGPVCILTTQSAHQTNFDAPADQNPPSDALENWSANAHRPPEDNLTLENNNNNNNNDDDNDVDDEIETEAIFKRVSIVRRTSIALVSSSASSTDDDEDDEKILENNEQLKPQPPKPVQLKGILRNGNHSQLNNDDNVENNCVIDDGFELINLPEEKPTQRQQKRSVTYMTTEATATVSTTNQQHVITTRNERIVVANEDSDDESRQFDDGYSCQKASIFFDDEEPEMDQQ